MYVLDTVMIVNGLAYCKNKEVGKHGIIKFCPNFFALSMMRLIP